MAQFLLGRRIPFNHFVILCKSNVFSVIIHLILFLNGIIVSFVYVSPILCTLNSFSGYSAVGIPSFWFSRFECIVSPQVPFIDCLSFILISILILLNASAFLFCVPFLYTISYSNFTKCSLHCTSFEFGSIMLISHEVW